MTRSTFGKLSALMKKRYTSGNVVPEQKSNLEDIVRLSSDDLNRYAKDYLIKTGWFESVRTKHAVNLEGPVPWLTYPALRELESIVKPHFNVLEYGAGNSSLWWSQRVAQVVSVEHDPHWADYVRTRARPNNTIIEVPMDHPLDKEFQHILDTGFFAPGFDPGPGPDAGRNYRSGLLSRPFAAYAAEVLRYPEGYFDIIVIDGMARVLTAWLGSKRVGKNGFILFDNSDREDYAAGYALLERAGFRRIDFWGPGPINPYEWCTSIFTQTLEIF